MRALIADFRSNTRANVAIICAVSAIPLVSAVGCVVDYSMASMVRTKLQAAADAATLASVSVNSPVISTARNMTGNGNVSTGTSYATAFFNAQTTAYSNVSSTISVTKTGQVIAATVSYSYNVPTYFLGIIGHSTITVSGSSTASYTLPTYIDFYLMLDVSGSMGFPSTTSEQTRLQNVNPDNNTLYPNGCTFACHFTAQGVCPQSEQGAIPAVKSPTNPSPGGYCQGFIISRLGTTPASGSLNGNNVNWTNTQVSSCPTAGTTACIQLRADAVGYAVNELLATAAASEVVTNQFRVGLYPFIEYLYSYFPLTTSLSGSPTTPGTINYAAAQLATLLDTGQNSNLGSGGTHFENAFPSMNSLISSVGNGSSSSNTLPYVFLVTDGVDNSQTYPPFTGSAPQLFSTSLCSALQSRGITVAVLYIPYVPIQNPTSFAGGEDYAVNALIPPASNAVPNNLQACASPNFFFTASTPADIDNALITMFEQAVSTAHVTN